MITYSSETPQSLVEQCYYLGISSYLYSYSKVSPSLLSQLSFVEMSWLFKDEISALDAIRCWVREDKRYPGEGTCEKEKEKGEWKKPEHLERGDVHRGHKAMAKNWTLGKMDSKVKEPIIEGFGICIDLLEELFRHESYKGVLFGDWEGAFDKWRIIE